MATDQYGRIIRRSGPIQINRNTSFQDIQPVGYNFSIWERFDYTIGRIGNWFAEYSLGITEVLCIILGLCMVIPFIIWLISLGWLWGIVAGILLGGIAYYATVAVIVIFAIISNISLAIIRYIFYNAWTFILTILIICGYFYFPESLKTNKPATEKTELVAPQNNTTKYRCTNSSLNVRAQPTTSSAVKGVIHRNDIVEVYDIYDGFGKIIYKGQTAYVGMKYLTPVK